MVRNLLRIAGFTFIVMVAGMTAYTQTSNGTIVGSVTDKSGGAVVGAQVKAVSTLTGAVRETTSNSEGTYRIEFVPPGTYDVSASATGYQTTTHSGLDLPGSAIVTADIVLTIGQTSQIVQVSADNTAINTANSEISATLSEIEINNLPIPSLSPYELAITLPGVMTDEQQEPNPPNGVTFISGGGRPRGNNFLIEGQDNNDTGITGQGYQPENDEAYSEIRVLQDNYTAEFGHGAGSVSNLIFKSGTNQFHGAVYLRTENSSLDAVDKQDHFNQVTTKTKYRQNYPGFRIGGPIVRNKVFFFASYQWDFYRATANQAVLSIPTAAGLATLKALPANPRLTNLLTAWGKLVGTINTANQKPSIPLGPDPSTGLDRGTVQVGTAQRALGAATDSPELDLTGDYIPSQTDTLRLRLIRTRITAPIDAQNFPSQLAGFDSDQDGIAWNAGIVETHVFNPRLLNEFRTSYGRIGFIFGLPASTTSNPLYNQPVVTVSGLTGYGIPAGVIPQGRFHNTYQLQDTLSWTHGKHVVKIGADIANIRVRDDIPFNFWGTIGYTSDLNATPYSGGTVTYKGLANLIDDFGGSTSTVQQNFGDPVARPNFYLQNYFVDDTFRPIPSLSVEAGLRYEYNGAPFNSSTLKYPGIDVNQIACFPTAANACNSRQQADGKEFGPRIGAAWTHNFIGSYATVIRSGFGIFYDPTYTNIADNAQGSAPNTASPQIFSVAGSNNNRGTGQWAEQFANLNKNPKPTDTADPILNNLKYPRLMHWNFAIEQEIPWSSSFAISYIGERGDRLYGNTNLNPYVDFNLDQVTRVVPTRGFIIAREDFGDSQYHGVWSEFDHKFKKGLLFKAGYTYAKLMDDVGDIFTFNNESSYQFGRYPTPRRKTDWGPSAYDHRQRLVLTYVWQPATWHTEGAMKAVGNVVNHWSISGVTQFQSGIPINVEDGYDNDGDGINNDRPLLGSKKAPMDTFAFDDSWFYGTSQGTLCSGPSLWYTNDPCHVVTASQVRWIIPAFDTHPTNPVGKNAVFTPGYQLWNMSIARSFKVYENATFDFRGEFLNVFNHGQPGVPNATLTGFTSPGINTDQFNNNGTNIFDDIDPTVHGSRSIRFVARIQF